MSIPYEFRLDLELAHRRLKTAAAWAEKISHPDAGGIAMAAAYIGRLSQSVRTEEARPARRDEGRGRVMGRPATWILGVIAGAFWLAAVLIFFVFATGQTFGQRCEAMGYTGLQHDACVTRLSSGGE